MRWTPRTVFIEYDIIPCSKSTYLLWGPHRLVFKDYLGDLEKR
jgi:hypothetical protein